MLSRPHLGFDSRLAATGAEAFRDITLPVDVPAPRGLLKRDPKDEAILLLSLTAEAHFLVTGNGKHFEELRAAPGDLVYAGTRIISPREFVEILHER